MKKAPKFVISLYSSRCHVETKKYIPFVQVRNVSLPSCQNYKLSWFNRRFLGSSIYTCMYMLEMVAYSLKTVIVSWIKGVFVSTSLQKINVLRFSKASSLDTEAGFFSPTFYGF